MNRELLNSLIRYKNTVKQDLDQHEPGAIAVILQLLTIVDYLVNELERCQGCEHP